MSNSKMQQKKFNHKVSSNSVKQITAENVINYIKENKLL